MKGIKHTYLFILFATMTAVMVACSSDNSTDTRTEPIVGKARVTLRLATGEDNAVTRAWQDGNAKTDRSEMMYNWIVLITDGSKIKYKYSGAPEEAKAEIDNVCTNVEMEAGTYSVYSFANISEASLKTLLSISSLEAGTTLADATVAAATATVNGNSFDPTADNANGFGCKGIPMSNKQSLIVPSSGSISKDLIVVRMLAKIKLSIENKTGAEQHIKYATISNVTKNEANNLKLLPNWTSATGKDNMDAQHGDLQPNLNATPTTEEITIPGIATPEALANNATREVTFYINECKKPTEFYLTIGLGDATNTNEYRYALIDNKGKTTADDGKWDYIARNDYRIIPITLDDYKFELIPYDFPPIGVYPVSVSEIDNVNHIYNFTFHDYGHFHLLPKVTKTSDNSIVEYSSATTPSGTAWTLNTNWTGSWFTAATKGGAWLDADGITSNGFYRSGTGSTTADGDDEGQAPVWYPNTIGNPQWDPAASGNYQPFIFGYIADPDGTLGTDKKIYHEMKIKLYVGGAYRRDMIYRFYMTLSQDQMLYAPRRADAPRRRH